MQRFFGHIALLAYVLGGMVVPSIHSHQDHGTQHDHTAKIAFENENSSNCSCSPVGSRGMELGLPNGADSSLDDSVAFAGAGNSRDACDAACVVCVFTASAQHYYTSTCGVFCDYDPLSQTFDLSSSEYREEVLSLASPRGPPLA